MITEDDEFKRIESEIKRQAAQDKLDDDDAQGYIAEYEAALLISYQSGFADGKRSDQRKPLTDEEIYAMCTDFHSWSEWDGAEYQKGWLNLCRAIEAAHGIKEGT